MLHQPEMLVTFEPQFDTWTPKPRPNPKVAELREGLKKIKPLIDTHGNDSIPRKTVERNQRHHHALVKSIAP